MAEIVGDPSDPRQLELLFCRQIANQQAASNQVPSRRLLNPLAPPPPPRKIIQIAAAEVVHGDARVYALCNDGTLWDLPSYPRVWKLLPAIPHN